MTDKERIAELELQHHVDERLISLLNEIAFKQRDTINELR